MQNISRIYIYYLQICYFALRIQLIQRISLISPKNFISKKFIDLDNSKSEVTPLVNFAALKYKTAKTKLINVAMQCLQCKTFKQKSADAIYIAM